MQTKYKKVVVLILSYNGKHLLEEAISSYLLNDYPFFEVIVIDNGSTDGTKEWIEKTFPDVFVLRTEKNLGYSGGFNLGLDYAFNKKGADYVLITNNDVKADKNLVSELVKIANNYPDAGFVIGKVYYYDDPCRLQTVGKKYDPILWNGGHIGNREIDNGQYDVVCERDWCDDIYWLVKKKVWELTGGYDTEFAFQGEDFDWQVRAKKLGFKIVYTPYAKLWHKESMTIGKNSAFKNFYDSRNPLIIHMKYRSPEEFKKFFRIRVGSQLKNFPKLALKLRFDLIISTIRGIGSALFWGIKNKKLTARHFI